MRTFLDDMTKMNDKILHPIDEVSIEKSKLKKKNSIYPVNVNCDYYVGPALIFEFLDDTHILKDCVRILTPNETYHTVSIFDCEDIER